MRTGMTPGDHGSFRRLWGTSWCEGVPRETGEGVTLMCEANAYLFKDGKEELFLEAVDILENEGDQLRIANIFGEQKIIRGRIKSMSLVNHKILLEE
jgi:predicted RNA-binding protein